MNWKLILLFTIESTYSGNLSGSSNMEKWKKVSHLEELHNPDFLRFLNSMTTSCDLGIVFDDNDIKLLSSECGADFKCLKAKNVSTQNYDKKIDQVQIFNKHFMLIIFDHIKILMSSNEKRSLEKLVKYYTKYVTRMLSMLHTAKRKPQKWLVDIIIFLNFVVSLELETIVFFELIIVSEEMNPPEAYNILSFIDIFYNNDKIEPAYENAQFITKPNLLLFHLHGKHKGVTHKLKLDIDLNWKSVNSVFAQIAVSNTQLFNNRKWSMLLSEFYKYHTLIFKCIYVKMLFHSWFHVKLSYIMISKYKKKKKNVRFSTEVAESNEEQLYQHWSLLVVPLKDIMRYFLIKDGIFWTVLRYVINDITTLKIKKLFKLEVLLNNEFLKKVEILNLGEENDIVQQMRELSVVKNFKDNFKKITTNIDHLINNTNNLQKLITPLDASFINWCFDETED